MNNTEDVSLMCYIPSSKLRAGKVTNLWAEYITPEGRCGYNEYQVPITDVQEAVTLLHWMLAMQCYRVGAISVVHGKHTLEELTRMHRVKEKRGVKVELAYVNKEIIEKMAVTP